MTNDFKLSDDRQHLTLRDAIDPVGYLGEVSADWEPTMETAKVSIRTFREDDTEIQLDLNIASATALRDYLDRWLLAVTTP